MSECFEEVAFIQNCQAFLEKSSIVAAVIFIEQGQNDNVLSNFVIVMQILEHSLLRKSSSRLPNALAFRNKIKNPSSTFLANPTTDKE